MRAAPQVLYPLGKPRLWHALIFSLLMLSLALIAAVSVLQPGQHLPMIMGLGVVLALALTVREAPPAGSQLRWDGESWHLVGPRPLSGQLHLVLDAQRVLLLRWISPLSASSPAPAWLWIEQDADPVIWKDVRRAIYWHAR